MGSEWVKNKRQRRDQPWGSPGRCLFSCSGAGQGVLTFDFMLGLLSPPLKLFAVIVEPLEAHDAVLEAGAATTQGNKESPSPAGRVAGRDLHPSLCAPHRPKGCSSLGMGQDTTLSWKMGNVPPFHGNSPLHQLEPVPAA